MTEPTASRIPLWIRVTLVLSLAVNLLIAGIVVGAAVSHRGDRPDGDRLRAERDLGPVPFVMALEPEDRRALGRRLAENGESFRKNRAELRQRFEALLAALRADTFDVAAVQGLLAEQRGLAASRQEIGERIFLERLQAMSLEERRAYADRLDKSLRRGAR